jgi:predicted NUDIX family phosphoesterase
MEKILAVRIEDLFGHDSPNDLGKFISKEEAQKLGIEEAIKSCGKYLPKGNLENNPHYKQIVTYCLLFDEDHTSIFTYKRAGSESRLRDQWSLGVGGHVYQRENPGNDEIKSGLVERSIGKELRAVAHILGLKLRGYINCDDNPVNSVHFGALYFGELHNIGDIKVVSKNKLKKVKFRTTNEIEKIRQNKGKNSNQHGLEEWSEIAYDILMRKEFRRD